VAAAALHLPIFVMPPGWRGDLSPTVGVRLLWGCGLGWLEAP